MARTSKPWQPSTAEYINGALYVEYNLICRYSRGLTVSEKRECYLMVISDNRCLGKTVLCAAYLNAYFTTHYPHTGAQLKKHRSDIKEV